MNVAVRYRGALVAMLVAVASACEATRVCPLTPDDAETGSFMAGIQGGQPVMIIGEPVGRGSSSKPAPAISDEAVEGGG